MKKHILIAVAACLFACKTRQISTSKTSTTDKSVINRVTKNTISLIDTTKTSLSSLNTLTQKDSVEIEILPDTGTIQIVSGNYIGKARNIIIKKTLSLSEINKQELQQHNGRTVAINLIDSINQKKDIQTQDKTKTVTAKGINLAWYLIALLAILLSVYLFFRRMLKI